MGSTKSNDNNTNKADAFRCTVRLSPSQTVEIPLEYTIWALSGHINVSVYLRLSISASISVPHQIA